MSCLSGHPGALQPALPDQLRALRPAEQTRGLICDVAYLTLGFVQMYIFIRAFIPQYTRKTQFPEIIQLFMVNQANTHIVNISIKRCHEKYDMNNVCLFWLQLFSTSLLWSQAEQGTTQGQDWLLGPE